MSESAFTELGQYIADSRKLKGLTQAEIASLLGFSSPQKISEWERGTSAIPMQKIYQLRELLDLNMHKLTECILIGSDRFRRRVPPLS